MRGNDLKTLRINRGVKGNQIAKALKISSARISQIEAGESVPEGWVARYVQALKICEVLSIQQKAGRS